MRYALFSDIHANLPALEAVLESIAAQPEIAASYHLGDIVGYGPWPNETISLLDDLRIPGVQGNHDARTALSRDPGPPPALPLSHTEWTARVTTPAGKSFLAQLPFRMDIRPGGGHLAGAVVTLLHGTVEASNCYWFGDEPVEFFRDMAHRIGASAGDLVCCAHTHLPWHRVVDGIHFLNSGSVGRPKDGDWRAGYVIVEVGEGEPAVEFRRVEYDIDRTIDEIRRSPLPDRFAEFLRSGGRTEDPTAE